MGLASAMSTALTGLTAAETTIDVIGNNLANSNTVGFKASEANFATQFSQTQSLGSSPTDYNGGTNPRQIGLGTMVADITPNFKQGTIEISSSPTDLAIQDDGFFIVQGQSGEQLFTRNGQLKLNEDNELTTMTGNRLLGYGVDDEYQIQTTELEPLVIPLGAAAVAQPTSNVYLEGTLSPTGDLATQAEIIETGVLGDSQYTYPTDTTNRTLAATAATSGITDSLVSAGGSMTPGERYSYRIVFADQPIADETGSEATPSTRADAITIDVLGVGVDAIELDNLPNNPDYQYIRIYRTTNGADPTDPTTEFYYVDEVPMGGGPVVDGIDDATLTANQTLNEDTLSESYSYYVTFYDTDTDTESRPSNLVPSITLLDGRIHLSDIPQPDPADPAGWDTVRIYRTAANDTSEYYEVTEFSAAASITDYTDNMQDAELITHDTLDRDGPKITGSTLLVDVQQRDEGAYIQMFEEGTLSFTARKGDRALGDKEFEITDTTTVLDLVNFMEQAMGIQSSPGPDPLHPVPIDEGSGDSPGGYITPDGKIQFVSNNGTDNAVEIGLSGLQLTTASGTENVNLPFNSAQNAIGDGAVADFIVYDSLGIAIPVRLTTVLESRDNVSTTYRWYATSSDNSPSTGADITVGTGLITFDGEGNFIGATEDTISIERRRVSSASPLEFELNFEQLSGLATDNSTLDVSRQDGSGPGVLTSFIVGEDGTISGVFSNGITRDLGQIVLARFGNPEGLEQKGENLYGAGVNSGLPVIGSPGEQGIGSIVAGAVELSNTDIGGNLIDLILASTMYRGNTRVITTAQEMFDELLNLNR